MDRLGTRRRWIAGAQLGLAAVLAVLAGSRIDGGPGFFVRLLTLVGLIAMVAGGRGYLTDAAVRPGMFFAGLVAVVAGSALVRWARRAPPE